MATIHEKADIVYQIIRNVEQPKLDCVHTIALKEALYTLSEAGFLRFDDEISLFMMLLDFYCLVQSALNGTLEQHLPEFRM